MAKPLILLSVLLLPAQGFRRAEEPSHIYAVGEKYAVMMGPPEIVAGAYGRELIWTADGSSLVVERLIVGSDVPPSKLIGARQMDDLDGIASLARRHEIVAWNLRSGRLLTLLAYDSTVSHLDNLCAIPNSDRLCLSMTNLAKDPLTGAVAARSGFLIVSAGTGLVVNVERPPSAEPAHLEFSPQGQGVMILRRSAKRTSSVALILPNGRLGSFITLPERNEFHFEADGTPIASSYRIGPNGALAQKRRIDLRTGAFGPPSPLRDVQEEAVAEGREAPATMAAEPNRPPRKVPEIGVYEVQMSPKSRGVVIRLAPGNPEDVGIVTADGAQPFLSPGKDAVVYQSGGSVFIRRLTKLSLDEFRIALQEAEKARAIARGKEIGTALSLYAMDADDIMPPPGTNVAETVKPYTRHNSVFDGFVYTYGGSSGPEGPGKTELGYLPIAGGRVVVYGDGHVAWVPDRS